jgi:hypothetical protein
MVELLLNQAPVGTSSLVDAIVVVPLHLSKVKQHIAGLD